MRRFRLVVMVCAAMALALPSALTQSPQPPAGPITEAPAAYDGRTNGFLNPAQFEEAKEVFDELEFNDGADGLGPVYNAQGCGECHQTPVSGGSSQVTELRAGRLQNGTFIEHPGGSLINDRAIEAVYQEVVLPGHDVRTLRGSLSTLGDGFVEAVDSNTLVEISRNQPFSMRGQVIQVPVLEAPGSLRVGRFGWKNQHASLQSFSGDAYLNEMGITTPMFPVDNTSMGKTTTYDGRTITDGVADPEDDGADLLFFANFMRSTKAPPREAGLANRPDAKAGEQTFEAIGCAVCHTPSIVTAPPGTRINGGTFQVPAALGNKRIRPFGDFLLHDVGTGDGIVQNGGPSTRNKLRTPPLWGLRTKSRFMHDGLSLTVNEAILRHGGQAGQVTNRYRGLGGTQRKQLLAFLKSL
jgi:CxxC motif-containing protein (DUF1111 family)